VAVRTLQVGSPLKDSSSDHDYKRLKPGPSQQPLDVAANQRARLLRAIIHLAARDGVDAITVRKLTRLARVSTGTFYSRFSGIDHCLLTAYSERMSGMSRLIVETRASDLEPVEQMDRALRRLVANLLADREVARFVLIEIYGGGPAAIAAIDIEERRLESAFRACIDRRGKRVSKMAAGAISAASLHCARVALVDARSIEPTRMVGSLVAWACDVIEDNEDLGIPVTAADRATGQGAMVAPYRPPPGDRDEEDLILAAILRLARRDGFHGLDPGKVSSVAGLPTARFRRQFTSLTDGYLTALRRTCGSFFVELTTHGDPDSPTRKSIRTALQQAARRAISDPPAARLTFTQIVEPGIPGLTCREALIKELALACTATTPPGARPRPIRAEASIAALWATLAMSSRAG
jgi:AcrR family transcriptional regulator